MSTDFYVVHVDQDMSGSTSCRHMDRLLAAPHSTQYTEVVFPIPVW